MKVFLSNSEVQLLEQSSTLSKQLALTTVVKKKFTLAGRNLEQPLKRQVDSKTGKLEIERRGEGWEKQGRGGDGEKKGEG